MSELPAVLTPKDRFWAHVRKGDGCWEWQGHRTPRGYGHLTSDKRSWIAHRLAWTFTNGPIPAGMQVLHRCDNPPCVRPDHLFLGTDLDNQRDAIAKGRRAWRVGADARQSSLTAADIVEIRRLAAEGVTQADLGRLYGVSNQTVNFIVRRRTWRHVP